VINLTVLNKNIQDPILIEGLDERYTYGDVDDDITVSGGSGSGAFTLQSSNLTVATVTAVNATDGAFKLTIVGAGSFTLTAGKKGDDTHAATEQTSSSVTVAPAQLTIAHTDVEVPAIEFGQKLKETDISSGLGYTFTGAAADGNRTIPGTLAWKSPETAAASDHAKEDGSYSADVIFTPASDYASRYAPFEFTIPVTVIANAAARTELMKAIDIARGAIQKIALEEENYDAEVIEKLKAAITEADNALAGNLTQARADTLIGLATGAIRALTHTHPILANSAENPIIKTGESLTIRIKGAFSSVKQVTLNGSAFDFSQTSETRYDLAINGTQSGTLTEGSAIIMLAPAYVDSLRSGTYTIEVLFRDGYMDGKGTATFIIDRPEPEAVPEALPQPQPSPDNAVPAPAGGTGNAESPAPEPPVSPDPDSGVTGNDSDNRPTASSPDAADTGISAGILIAIAVILLLGALFIFFAAKRRRRAG
jgi:hypothetical protein